MLTLNDPQMIRIFFSLQGSFNMNALSYQVRADSIPHSLLIDGNFVSLFLQTKASSKTVFKK